MNIQHAFERINQTVFKTTNLEEILSTDIVKIKNRCPYFMLTRYLLAYKKKQKFQTITLEAGLESDPLWFGYVLENMDKSPKIQNKEATTTSELTTTEMISEPPVIKENIHLDTIQNNQIKLPPPTILEKNIPLSTTSTIENKILPLIENTTKQENEEVITQLPNKAKNETIPKEKIEKKDNTSCSFVPLHVEDYFGALNIHIPESFTEEKPLSINKLSKNQKPFVGWLEEFSYSTPKNNSITLSEKNNTPVASETMAEIWIAEKRYDKAISTYQKLSLLFPEKSIYFAQKISELKNLLK
ncbi:MAG: hypothetical protein ACRCR9_04610 [Chitinophagaceae bacterium]